MQSFAGAIVVVVVVLLLLLLRVNWFRGVWVQHVADLVDDRVHRAGRRDGGVSSSRFDVVDLGGGRDGAVEQVVGGQDAMHVGGGIVCRAKRNCN